MEFLGTKVGKPTYIPQTAWLEHAPFAMWLVRRLQPRRIVELGTHYGYSYFAMCQAISEGGLQTQCCAVDTWHGDEHAGHYDESVFEGVLEENEKYEAFSRLLRKTFADALSDIENGSVDLLHVDGRHFYEDVKEDFETWIPKLSSSAVVLFHDTEVRERHFGVHRYWAEICDKRPSLNFRHCHGLGVLFWGEEIPPGVKDLLGGPESMAGHRDRAILDYFSAVGAALSQECEQNSQMASVRAELTERDKHVRELSAELAECHKDVQQMSAELAEHEGRIAALETQHTFELDALHLRLVDARLKPFKSARRNLVSASLYFLARLNFLFSRRHREEFVRTAKQHDPRRREEGVAKPPHSPV